MPDQRRVAVVGAGVSGLATAYHLLRAAARSGQPAPAITVLEATDHVGGKVLTADVAGFGVDTGPDALLVRMPAVAELLAELGLTDSVRGPAVDGAFIWTRGSLRRLPPASLFGVPERLLPLLRGGLIGPWGMVRAGADLVLPRRRHGADPSIAAMLRPRLGAQVFDRLVDPMLGGVHAGRADLLSARSAVPEVYAIAERHRSVYLAMRRRERARPGGRAKGPALVSLDGGLGRLVDVLRCHLDDVDLRTGSPVVALRRPATEAGEPVGGFLVEVEGGDPILVDDVVVTAPAFAAARLVRPLSADAARVLGQIPYVGVATVTLAYPRADVGRPLDGTGFLVPPVDGRLLVGCSWLTAKWAHLDSDDVALFRCMVGRAGDQAWTQMDDDTLVAAAHAELAAAVGLSSTPAEAFVQRWPDAMPQYTVGHAQRLAALDDALAHVPGLYLSGAAYRGVGLAGCITQAKTTAAAVMQRRLATPAQAGQGVAMPDTQERTAVP